MNFLVQALWIEGEAADRHVTVTAAQIKKSYNSQRATSKPPLKTTKQLNEFLAKSGQTNADLIWRTKLNLLATAIQLQVTKQASKVSSAAIAAYYKKNHAQFVTPKTLNIHLIETSTLATANKVKSLLTSGQSYATLAPKYSIDPTSKGAGGKLLAVRPGQLTTLAQRRGLQGADRPADRADQDPVRLLPLHRRQRHAGLDADAQAGDQHDQGHDLRQPGVQGQHEAAERLHQEVDDADASAPRATSSRPRAATRPRPAPPAPLRSRPTPTHRRALLRDPQRWCAWTS